MKFPKIFVSLHIIFFACMVTASESPIKVATSSAEQISSSNSALTNEVDDKQPQVLADNNHSNDAKQTLEDLDPDELSHIILTEEEFNMDQIVDKKSGNNLLMWACRNHHENVVQALLQKGYKNLDAQNNFGNTALIIAADEGCFEIARNLIAKGANATIANSQNRTALFFAILSKNYSLKLVELILCAGADANTIDINYKTPLHEAVFVCDPKLVKLLLTYKANPNLGLLSQFSVEDHRKEISEFVTGGNLRLKPEEIDQNTTEIAKLIAKNKNNNSIEEPVIDWKNITKILASGNKPDIQNLIVIAAAHNKQEVVRLLLLRDDIDFLAIHQNHNALTIASHQGYIEIVRMLLKKIPVDSKDIYGTTPLLFACSRGHIEIVKLLLRNWANPNVHDKSGTTPLHLAAFHNSPELVDLLIANKADVACANGRNVLDDTQFAINQQKLKPFNAVKSAPMIYKDSKSICDALSKKLSQEKNKKAQKAKIRAQNLKDSKPSSPESLKNDELNEIEEAQPSPKNSGQQIAGNQSPESASVEHVAEHQEVPQVNNPRATRYVEDSMQWQALLEFMGMSQHHVEIPNRESFKAFGKAIFTHLDKRMNQ